MERQRYAFISYNHKDVKWATWLHRKLEGYKLPTEIHNEFEDSKYLRPIFRDKDDLNAGILGNELRQHLESSKFLIVICSENSAKSEWVNNEVKAFIEMGRIEYIIPFILPKNGKESSSTLPLPRALKEYFEIHPEQELLGVSVDEVGKSKAFVRTVSRMLGVSFDELWKRHERERRRRIATIAISTPIIAALVYWFAAPVNLSISIADQKHSLPIPENAVLTVDGAEYPLTALDTVINIEGIPGYKRLQNIPVKFTATYYDTIEQEISIGIGTSQKEDIQLERDKTFAVYAGKVFDDDGNPVEGATVVIDTKGTTTDAAGEFRIVFPVNEQSLEKIRSVSKEGYTTSIRNDESPNEELTILLHR